MEKAKLELAVGAFVLVGIICLGYLSIKLGKLEIIGGNLYNIDAEFDSVSGLKPGATVEIAGVEVGRVKAITLKEDRGVVRAKHFRPGARFEIRSQGSTWKRWSVNSSMGT